MKAIIRLFEDRDIGACRQLWVELTERHREIYDSPTIGGDDPGHQFDEHLQHANLAGIWVAEQDGEVVGLVGLLHSEEETEVEPIVVRPGQRSKGIGKLLLERMTEEARARNARYLSIRPVARNTEAIALFVSEGFDLLGHIQLFKTLLPSKTQWKDGLRIHDADLRY